MRGVDIVDIYNSYRVDGNLLRMETGRAIDLGHSSPLFWCLRSQAGGTNKVKLNSCSFPHKVIGHPFKTPRVRCTKLYVEEIDRAASCLERLACQQSEQQILPFSSALKFKRLGNALAIELQLKVVLITDVGQPGVINSIVNQIPDMFTCIKVFYSSTPTTTSGEPLASRPSIMCRHDGYDGSTWRLAPLDTTPIFRSLATLSEWAGVK